MRATAAEAAPRHDPRESALDDEFAQLFPDCVLTHQLTIVGKDGIGAALEALSGLRTMGGGLERMRLVRADGKATLRLSVTGLRSRQARLLSSRLAAAAAAGVECAYVEHQILRATGAADGS